MCDLVVFVASQAVRCRTLPQQRRSSLFVVIPLSFYSAPSLKLLSEFCLSLNLRIISYSNRFGWSGSVPYLGSWLCLWQLCPYYCLLPLERL
ncbi:hypothetical protein LIPSTDRAFT_70571 [Lipomyces starkeyi NRRL Y-11557]|uniref:Uncharacterized protein n=1 Tax=Lipomyces starkeyi NRRL Y-11557 TaxID=675824 RepID=A0A1E3Q8S4_LIPST|nr:hypothetical protein LIPSTDRAFT_70571 [Lipomyces starkeyi NRRL Y-11557]